MHSIYHFISKTFLKLPAEERKKHGQDIGLRKWKEYCDKQAKSNTFEYKRDKYGWTKEKFDEYNKSRSVTLENLVKKHGEENGLILWRDYCDRQKYTTSLDYFISEYGIDNGTEKYNNFCKKRLFGVGYSEVSKTLFDTLKEKINTEMINILEEIVWKK